MVKCGKYVVILELLLLTLLYNLIKRISISNNGEIIPSFVDAYNWNILERWKAITPKEKLEYKVNHDLGLDIDAEIGDFGDYNSDVKTDLILFKYDKTTMTSTIFVYIFSPSENKFVYHTEAKLEGKIVNLMVIDLNFDGSLDVLVLFKDNNSQDKFYISTFIQNESDELEERFNSKIKETENESISDLEDQSFYFTNIHPLLCDINNDGLPDLIAQHPNKSKSFSRFIWINNGNDGFKSILWENMDLFEYTDLSEISNPNSNAIVDLNGDCKADLVFTVINKKNTKRIFLEIWINKIVNGKSRYVKADEDYMLPANSMQIIFADFNADGSIDMVVPTCVKSSSCNYCCTRGDKIYFIPNIQTKICENSWTKNEDNKCRLASNLCSESDFEFANKLSPDYISLLDDKGLHFYGDASYPSYLSVGDVDDDGYLDLLVSLRNDKGQNFVRIYKNEQISNNDPNHTDIRRFYNYYQFISSVEKPTPDVYNAAFFDIFENGILDVIIFGTYNSNSKVKKYSSVGFVRSNETDSLFLKSTALNGICVNDCYKEKDKISTKTLGGNAHGPTFKITVIDANGTKSSKIGIQKSQSAHSPLQLPYVLFGLGRTSNYVEEFYVGMPTHEQSYYNMWVSIIPNSHIIVIPYPLDDSHKWQIQLSVNPSNKFYSIIYITLICLSVIGVLIFIFDRKEKVEDSKEEMGFKSHFVIG
ncbi:conserved Plasmodium protein, unknown function [Plasmodium berghei]|uniref:T-cell immunomodulatory protein TIP C2 domain-containing protein n=2 Tax=Plasmodium berghei TaxID=5821 RepID=A0A509APD4_PLABA|nr:conserved Plasmodium protein, unknown function [Plasmodium berghei ANKA]CXI83938.1 conserved Plasmodium protein, unknown function [Plasmodium berghei]SCM25743.1 conserved Plasmodium protein, unknown function [Plasmodium berghei]SCN27478.1 conserved Plasmodium protein, unknown function [Plasmodium berghei]SCO62195.1 conserved Plasmodium protein, unknown function [Plasmodium berghei]SCO63905.1 conserved Plasmodium protein, unknown function [Plasmodium berghei]|eukprot:XP_034423110.1 conserved Plasmodium protein, unknown function [Plasmodium berghei ANKA]